MAVHLRGRMLAAVAVALLPGAGAFVANANGPISRFVVQSSLAATAGRQHFVGDCKSLAAFMQRPPDELALGLQVRAARTRPALVLAPPSTHDPCPRRLRCRRRTCRRGCCR